MTDLRCKGCWSLGTACGKCESCYATARELIPAMLKENRAMRDLLIGLRDELTEHGRFVSNPKLTKIAISTVLEANEFSEARHIASRDV